MHGVCVNCNLATPNEEIMKREPPDCPGCGHRHFRMTFHSTETFLLHGATLIKQRDPHRTGKQKIRREHFLGIEANKDGDLMLKERIIDRDSGVYFEHVQNSESGEVVRHCSEDIRSHTGHGSDKPRKP